MESYTKVKPHFNFSGVSTISGGAFLQCIMCNSDIEYSGKGRPKNICDDCRFFVPPSAICGQNYKFWKFLLTLSLDELRAMMTNRIQRSKYPEQEDIRQLRTDMTLINSVYKFKTKNRVYYGDGYFFE